MSGIIDAHSHYMPPEVAQNTAFFKVNWSDLDRQLAVMDEQGIEKSLLLYPTSDAHLNMGGWEKVASTYNQSLSEVVRKHRDRFIGAAIFSPDNEKARDNELEFFQESFLKAFSLASSYDGKYLDDEYFAPILQYANDHDIVVHIHSQILNPIGEERLKDPLLSPVLEYVFDISVCLGRMMMNGTFLNFPDVKFIFAHYGGVLPFVKERFDSTYTMLRKRELVKDLSKLPSEYFKNLYFDTSGSKSSASLLCMLEVVDASHILFGSDFPANQNLAASIQCVSDSSLSNADKSVILSSHLFNTN